MFATTFLGHQGWLFETERTRVLVDPLLREDFGQLHGLTYRVFPPRQLDPGAVPAIDALILSHEHDDHFDIPSLALIDRQVPVYLSARSSTAGHRILAEMGFTVHPLQPGIPLEIGDLEFVPYTGDHVSMTAGEEWDTLPFTVRQAQGAGSFFSLVDISLTPGHLIWARIHIPRPGLITWTNNAIDWSHMANYLRERVEATAQYIESMSTGHKAISSLWGQPSATLLSAGGFAFHGERAWMNERVFCVDPTAVVAAMSKTFGKGRFFSTTPGQRFIMEGNRLRQTEDETPFLRTAPRDTWPTRGRAGTQTPPDYEPATGRRALAPGEVERLERGLAELAGAMVGGAVFRGLCSLLVVESEGRKQTMALALRDGGSTRVYEYHLQGCAFHAVTCEHPDETYLAVMECWASDLLAVLEGELAAIGIMFGRARLWNALPGRFGFDPFSELWRVGHPLRRPDGALRAYRRLWAAHVGTAPVIGRR